MKITYDSRQCGTGKTTTGIYPLIAKNLTENKLTLVVVPSVKLQNQYKNEFNQALIINDELKYGYDSVQKAITAFVQKKKQLILVTHASFYELSLNDPYFNSYNLIIDEALEQVLYHNSIGLLDNASSRAKSQLNLQELYSFKQSHANQMELISLAKEQGLRLSMNALQIEVNDIALNAIMADELFNHKMIKQITHSNYDHYTSPYAYDALSTDGRTNAIIIHQLKAETITRFKTAYVACANFEMTKMFNWLKHQNIEMECIHEFMPHEDFNLMIYSPQESFKWSKTKAINAKDNAVKNAYNEFVKNNRHNMPMLTLRNNGNTNSFSNEIVLSHNVHGINETEWMACQNISIESSLNPHPVVKLFIEDYWFNGEKNSSMIDVMYSGSVYYQIIMRSILRTVQYNNEEVRIFCMAYSMVLSIMKYFTISVHEVDDRIVQFNIAEDKTKMGRKPTYINADGTPMTRNERDREARRRAKAMREETAK